MPVSPILYCTIMIYLTQEYRCIISYAYFHDLPQADLPYIKIPLHTVIKLTPKAYGCDEERYEFRSATAVAITDI